MWKYYMVECSKGFDGRKVIMPFVALSEEHAKDKFEGMFGVQGWLFISATEVKYF